MRLICAVLGRMQILRGRIQLQRFFDISETIDLPHAEKLIGQLSRRPRFVGSTRHIELANPPLEIFLGGRSMRVVDLSVQDILVRVYDVGALVVTFLVDIPQNMDGEELIALAKHIDDSEEEITRTAAPIADEIRAAIALACRQAESASPVTEEYTIFYIYETTPKCDGATFGNGIDLVRLLLADPGAIAPAEREAVVRSTFNYRPEDLVVVDWNSAVILDPTGGQDVPELLELTMMQMLELRAYDNVVGRALDSIYKDLDAERRSKTAFPAASAQRMSRRIMQLYIDVVEVTERIDNSLTFLGDTWLARLHLAAVREYQMARWQKQLRNKLDVLRQINELLVDQITSQKTMRLEAAVVFLIILEIVLALIRGT